MLRALARSGYSTVGSSRGGRTMLSLFDVAKLTTPSSATVPPSSRSRSLSASTRAGGQSRSVPVRRTRHALWRGPDARVRVLPRRYWSAISGFPSAILVGLLTGMLKILYGTVVEELSRSALFRFEQSQRKFRSTSETDQLPRLIRESAVSSIGAQAPTVITETNHVDRAIRDWSKSRTSGRRSLRRNHPEHASPTGLALYAIKIGTVPTQFLVYIRRYKPPE